MTTQLNATRQQWLAARLDLLEEEKELTRQSDALATKRQQLPRVRIDKQYRFETDSGNVSLKDLFGGRSQLLVYHFMFGPDYTAGCPSCSSIADGFNGVFVHLENHDVAFWAVSRAPLAKLEAFKQRMDWSFPWASSFGSDFNGDFSVWFSAEQQRQGEVDYNYRREPPAPEPLPGRTVQEWRPRDSEAPITQIAATTGTDVPTYTRDRPGVSAFELIDGAVYHSYSSYARGLDGLWGMYQWLDRAPKGRNETGIWWRHHDRYGKE
ncbi:thioredoxin family protein [Rhizobium laguerreae]